MKLFLSSLRLPSKNELKELFGRSNSLSVLIVPNAWDTYVEERQKAELAKAVQDFTDLECRTSVLDLVTSSEAERQNNLHSNDFLWVMGGNTFYLNYKFYETGFDKLIKAAFNKGLVYGGTSAGAVIAGPTLHGAEFIDDPKDAPQIIWEGLGLVDFGIVPHWGMEKYGPELQSMKSEMQPHVHQLVTLTNEQAAIVIDGELRIV